MSVPGSVCDAAAPILLRGGQATITSPPSLDAGTSQVVIRQGRVVYGDLRGNGQDVAAVDIWCTNTGGTADGQIKNSWVVFSTDTGPVRAIGTLVPQQPAGTAAPHVPYFDDGPGETTIRPGSVTVHELWYAPSDGTCCPSMRATTVWTYAGAVFSPSTTVQG